MVTLYFFLIEFVKSTIGLPLIVNNSLCIWPFHQTFTALLQTILQNWSGCHVIYQR